MRAQSRSLPFAHPESLKPTPIAFLSFLCGCAVNVRIGFVGEVFLAELLIVPLALVLVLSRGLGRGFHATTFFGFLVAGLITFVGYLLSDLVAQNEASQYLRGWGRVMLLLCDVAALMVLVAHGRRNLWWFVLGVALGGLASLYFSGVPLAQWKIGYGEYFAYLLVALAGLFPRWIAVLGIGAFGVLCVVLDYRSLGAAVLLTSGVLAVRLFGGNAKSRMLRGVAAAVAVVAVVGVLAMFLNSGEEEFEDRRAISNTGRYIGMVVAWRAILESPVTGHGSWARDEMLERELRKTARRLEAELGHPINFGESLLPHSQILQVWVEGGILGTAFFVFYGWGLFTALRWFALQRTPDALHPMSVLILWLGLWNLAASPFLGFTRIYIALGAAVIALAARERSEARSVRRQAFLSGESRPLQAPAR